LACGILFTLGMTNLVIVGLFPAFDRRADKLTDLAVPVLIAVALSFAEIGLAAAMRTWVERI